MSADNNESTKRKKIVIIGAGFGGLRFLYDVKKQFRIGIRSRQEDAWVECGTEER